MQDADFLSASQSEFRVCRPAATGTLRQQFQIIDTYLSIARTKTPSGPSSAPVQRFCDTPPRT